MKLLGIFVDEKPSCCSECYFYIEAEEYMKLVSMKLVKIYVNRLPDVCNDCIFVQTRGDELEDSWTLCCPILADEFGNAKDVDECYDKGRHSSCPLEIAR